jgi:hypothetical protein
METVKAVPEQQEDPKAGKPRAKSEVKFPYFDLDKSIEVAKLMHEKAGGACDLPQLATLLGYTGIRNGAFRMRVSAAKMFGLIEEYDSGHKMKVSVRGLAIVAQVTDQTASEARVQAFLAVELFKKVYEKFNGATLPSEVGLRNLLETEYQVVKDRVTPTVRIMLDSADQAGLFKAAGNRTRMVMPLSGSFDSASRASTVTPPAGETKNLEAGAGDFGGGGGGGSNGGGTGGGDIDEAFTGLLRKLPAIGTVLSAKRRKAFIDAFTATLDVIYPDMEGE